MRQSLFDFSLESAGFVSLEIGRHKIPAVKEKSAVAMKRGWDAHNHLSRNWHIFSWLSWFLFTKKRNHEIHERHEKKKKSLFIILRPIMVSGRERTNKDSLGGPGARWYGTVITA